MQVNQFNFADYPSFAHCKRVYKEEKYVSINLLTWWSTTNESPQQNPPEEATECSNDADTKSMSSGYKINMYNPGIKC